MNYLILALNILLSVAGQFFLKYGINKLDGFKGTEFLIKTLTNPFVVMGIACYGFGMLTWFAVLSKFDLSVAYPSLSIGYILVLLMSFFFLGEAFTITKVAGTALIMLGVILLFIKA